MRLDKFPDDILNKMLEIYKDSIPNEEFALILENIKDEKEAEKELLYITNYDRLIQISKLIQQDPRSFPNNIIPDNRKNLIKLINNRKSYLWIDYFIEKKLIIHIKIYTKKLKEVEEEFTNMKSKINNIRNDTDKFNKAQMQVSLISLQLINTKKKEQEIVEEAQNIQKKLKAGKININKDIIEIMKKTIDNNIKKAMYELDLVEFLQKNLVEILEKNEGGQHMTATFINKKLKFKKKYKKTKNIKK
jgi:hypothetical protein